MIEAVPVLVVGAVAVIAYTSARFYVANPANHDAALDLARLHRHRAWIAARIQLAWRENWEQAMVARLADELEATEAQLVDLEANPSKAS